MPEQSTTCDACTRSSMKCHSVVKITHESTSGCNTPAVLHLLMCAHMTAAVKPQLELQSMFLYGVAA